MMNHVGYQYLMEIAKAQVETRQQGIFLNPLKKMDEVLEQEYKKGEIAGIHLFMNLAEVRVTELRDIVKALTEELENDDETTLDDGSTSSFDGDTRSP